MKTVPVECYSGSRYAERPTAVSWQGKRLEIRQVLQSWRTPDGPSFDVLVGDGRNFRLMYGERCDSWTVIHITENRHMKEGWDYDRQ